MTSTSQESLEILKHRLSGDLEKRKWSFKKLELEYLEAGQHLRSLNQLMWQVPSIVIAITGGLWYGATTVDHVQARAVVLCFAALFSILTIFILIRLRSLIQMHIERQDLFCPKRVKAPQGSYTVIGCWTFALLGSAVVSALGACNPSHLSKREESPKETKLYVSEIEVSINPMSSTVRFDSTSVKSQPTALSQPPQCAK